MDENNNDQTNDNDSQQAGADEAIVNEASTPKDPVHKESLLKNTRVVVLAVVVMVLFGVGGLLLNLSLNDSNDEPSTASNDESRAEIQLASAIAVVEGDVEHSVDGESWKSVEGGETVQVEEYVRTLADSRAVVLLDDGSAVRLDENTQVQLTTSDDSMSEVMLYDGQVYTRVVESETRTFAVVTTNDRFEALGTAYKTSAGDDMDTVEVYQSKVKIDSDGTEVEEGNQYDTKDRKSKSIDISKLKDDDFVQWNKKQDSESDDFKDDLGVLDIEEKSKKEKDDEDEKPVVDEAPAGASIGLSAKTGDKGVTLEWSLNGASAPDGFKVVFDKSDSTPSYKENSANYVGGDTRKYTVSLDDGKNYHFRVCIYRASSGSCDTYSNSVSAKAPFVEEELVEAGDVTLTIDDDEVEWDFEGTAPHGFKVLLSSSEQPTYPANSIQYVGSDTTETDLPDKDPGTYYVRVCKYTADANVSGGCQDYSNQVMYVVAE